MSLPANQQGDDPVASTPRVVSPRRAGARLPRAGLAVVALLGAGVLAAACGGGPSSHGVASLGTTTTTAGPSASQGGNPASRALTFVKCMRTHGDPDMPEPVISGHRVRISVDPNAPQFTAAYNACRHLLPNNGVPRNTITPADQADYLKAAACMRSHGFPDFPDPVFQSNLPNVTFHISSSIDTNSDRFKRAVATCEQWIPAGLPYSSPSPS